jgi:hypothetical protein
MRIVLYNDTTLLNSHFGPQLVIQTLREQLAKRGMELIGSLHRDSLPQDNRSILSKANLVIVNGEGSIHHSKCQHLIDIANEYPAALINCVYQGNESNIALSKFCLVTARESRSANHLIECGAHDVEVVPDLMFAAQILREWTRAVPALDLGITDNVIDRQSGHPPFVPDPREYIQWLDQHCRVVCGRYHAAVACCVLGIPFSCWPSNTWKIEGMLDDIGLPHLCFATREQAMQNCPMSWDNEASQRIGRYVDCAQQKIERMFDLLSDLAHV